MSLPITAVVLAAGKGTRMRSPLPKVLHQVGGRAMVLRLMDSLNQAEIADAVVVTGFESQMVVDEVQAAYPNTRFAEQTEQLGTAHAVQQAVPQLPEQECTVVIVYGDAPLIPAQALQQLVTEHEAQGNDLTTITATAEDPTGFGRIVRDAQGNFVQTVECKECTAEQKEITEVSTCLYAVSSSVLREFLPQIDNNNAKGEYYLTALEGLALQAGKKVGTIDGGEADLLVGVNSLDQLAVAEVAWQEQKRAYYLANGVKMHDPFTVYFSYDTKLEPGCVIGPNVLFHQGVTVCEGVVLEGFASLQNCTIGSGSTVHAFSHVNGATIGENNAVGPFARLRPGAELAADVKVGNFVEIKKSTIGQGTKVNHLSYVGDAQVGAQVNVGAGLVTANYNRLTGEKAQTTVGDGASIGANNTLVAPVTVGAQAFTAAGATVRKDVPPAALGYSENTQKTKLDYVKPTQKSA